MTNLIWTDERPRVGGFYFYKHRPDCGCQVVDVGAYANGDLYALTGFRTGRVEQMDGQWAGPIPEPTEVAQPHYVDKAVGMDLNERVK